MVENQVQNPANNYPETFQTIQCNNIPIRKIQNVVFLVNKKVAQLSLDSGCEGDCIQEAECQRLGIPILPLDSTDTQPTQADGYSPVDIVGKVKFNCTRDKIVLYFEGYVAKNLQAPILCGGSFLSRNKITQELHNNKIVITGKYHILESLLLCPSPVPTVQVSHINNFQPNQNSDHILKESNCNKDVVSEVLDKILIEKNVPKHFKD